MLLHRRARSFPVLVVLGIAMIPGCASESAGAATSSPASSAVTRSTGVFGGTQTAACDTDLALVATAVESYLALEGGIEVAEAALVQQGLLRAESTLHDVGLAGAVIPAPGGGCVS